jgi:hypothetical protein
MQNFAPESSRSTENFTFPGTDKWASPSVYGGWNYSFASGWVIALYAKGTETSTLCSMSFKGLVHNIADFIPGVSNPDNDDKLFLNISQIRQLFEAVSKAP